MRLLNVHTFEFQTFLGDDVPNYSIASHRWVADESSIKDIIKRRNLESNGYKKVEGFCAYVRQANELYKNTHPELICDFLWIDTCCIDQKSSLEVDTAIRSMFQWYNKSVICYAYLADVEPLPTGTEVVEASFRDSVWFSRGWTLQELLAPRTVVFLTKKWEVIGHKCTSSAITDGAQCPGVGPRLNGMISEITGIPELVLYDYPRSKELSIEERMSWSAKRKTTRQEDSVYCLLGIFEIHMPVMYGEGEFAQIRLRNEIDKKMEAWEKGQKAGVQSTYNTRAPCATVKTTSHLPTVSQAAGNALPSPIGTEPSPEAAGVDSTLNKIDSNGQTRGSANAGDGQTTDPQDDLVNDLGNLRVKSKTQLAKIPSAPAQTAGASTGDDDDFIPKAPNRSTTFNMLREPYARNNSPGHAVSTTAWGAVPEEAEEEQAAVSRTVSAPPARAPPVPRQPSVRPPIPPIPGTKPVLPQASAPEQPATDPLPEPSSSLPPPPAYDSIWEEAPQVSTPVSEYNPALQNVSAWNKSNETFNTAPSRAATWSTGLSDMPPPTRHGTWSPPAEWNPPAEDHASSSSQDFKPPARTATSSFGDVPMSARAQRRLELTIAKEERKEERREKRRERLAKRRGTTASTADPNEDDAESDEDMVSNADSSFSGSTDQRSYSSGAVSLPTAKSSTAAPPVPQPSSNARMYDVVQDARRQDARRRFFAQGAGAPPPPPARVNSNSTDNRGPISPPPPPTRTKTNSSGLADLADSLPSGLRLTKTALRLLDSHANPQPRESSAPPADDEQSIAPSQATTARTKPVGRKELKEILKTQSKSSGPEADGRKMSPRDRLMSAVSSHWNNS